MCCKVFLHLFLWRVALYTSIVNLVFLYPIICEQFYLKNGTCKFGATCKFDHPKDFQLPSVGQENGIGEQNESVIKTDETTGLLNPGMSLFSHAPAMLHNSKGLPIRPVMF